jgi:hypothetical protein
VKGIDATIQQCKCTGKQDLKKMSFLMNKWLPYIEGTGEGVM